MLPPQSDSPGAERRLSAHRVDAKVAHPSQFVEVTIGVQKGGPRGDAWGRDETVGEAAHRHAPGPSRPVEIGCLLEAAQSS